MGLNVFVGHDDSRNVSKHTTFISMQTIVICLQWQFFLSRCDRSVLLTQFTTSDCKDNLTGYIVWTFISFESCLEWLISYLLGLFCESWLKDMLEYQSKKNSRRNTRWTHDWLINIWQRNCCGNKQVKSSNNPKHVSQYLWFHISLLPWFPLVFFLINHFRVFSFWSVVRQLTMIREIQSMKAFNQSNDALPLIVLLVALLSNTVPSAQSTHSIDSLMELDQIFLVPLTIIIHIDLLLCSGTRLTRVYW